MHIGAGLEQFQELGHEVIVANVRELRAISHSDRKSDQVDAEKLARYARLDPEILRPISPRAVEQQEALTLIRARFDPRDELINSSINSPLEPQPAPNSHQDSSSRVRIETQWRATCGATKPGATTKAKAL